MRKAHGLVLASLSLGLALAPAAAWLGCDGQLPFEGTACRERAEKAVHVGLVQLLDAERTADATLVLWRSREGAVEGPLWLSLRNSAGWRAPMALDSRSTGLRREALTGRDVLLVVANLALGVTGAFDPDAGLTHPPNARATRFDSECGEHESDPLDLDPAAQLALDPTGRAALAWAEQGAIEARLVRASGGVEAATAFERDGALAELRGLVALAPGGFMLAMGEHGLSPIMPTRLLTSRWHDGAWQAPLLHAHDVQLASLAAAAGRGAALAWTTWDGARGELLVRRTTLGESWGTAFEAHASAERIDELRLVASRRDGRLVALFRQGGTLFAQLLDERGVVAGLGRVACDCELAGAAFALDEEGALVIVRPRAGRSAELLRFDGWTFEREVELGDAGAEVTGTLLAAAPDGRLTAVYVQADAALAAGDDANAEAGPRPSQRIMAVELARGRPGRAVPILAR